MPMPSETSLRDRPVTTKRMTELKDQLRKQAYFYDSPQDFRAGVEAALNAMIRETRLSATDEIDITKA